MGRYAKQGVQLSDSEIARTFSDVWGQSFPPILDVTQAAELAHVEKKTIYDWSYRGLLKNCAAKRGKRLRLFRDRFVRFLLENKE